MKKIDESIDFVNDTFQNQELKAETLKMMFEAYTKAQIELLLTLDNALDNKKQEANNYEKVIGEKSILEILNEAWEITNDVDDLLQEYGAHRNNHLQSIHYETVIDAWNRLMTAYDNHHVKKKGFSQRATYLLEQMERLASDETKRIQPTVETYNKVLSMWSRSQEHLLSTSAESIIRRMARNTVSPTKSNLVHPNDETYRIMIRAWCRMVDNVASSKTKIGNAAFNASGYLIQLQANMERGNAEFEPTLDDYKVVFEAWAKAGYAKFAGRRALSILTKMENLATSESDLTSIKPDVDCYRFVLKAFSASKAQYVTRLGEEGERILARMEENGLIPDSDCFSYVIQTWCNSACRNELTEEEISHDALRAHKLLDQKLKMRLRSGIIEINTTRTDYNNVMRAWSHSSSSEANEHIMNLLSSMERLYGNGDENMKPNFESYLHTINIMHQQEIVSDPTPKVFEILDRMKQQYEKGNEQSMPHIQCYNAAIGALGTHKMKEADADIKRNALSGVIRLIKKVKDSTIVVANSFTYRFALESLSNLMDKRSVEYIRVIDSLFNRCCDEGVVDDTVIKAFHRASPHDLYRKLVLSAASMDTEMDGTIISETLFLPEEWTRNIDGFKQRIPLDVDGRFVRSRSVTVAKRKMRRLRRKERQVMLQGGRS